MIRRTNIKFEQLQYGVKSKLFSKNEKIILKNINGEFRSCELSAVVGASGSGKTTLLHVLSGFFEKNVCGSIRINGDERDDESFRKQSTYIMQEENLFLLLTVWEAMCLAINLKTGNFFKKSEQKTKIVLILKTLGLIGRSDEFTYNLSGGEQKRLSIALELVDDPAILFLDEPTTGLDSSSSSQCIRLLKKLAQEGKTIVCTIHSPSAFLLEMFDHLYALSDGCCIYQGSSKNLITFLKEIDLICPELYNPCDYLLEIATEGSQNNQLIKKIQNGSNDQFRSVTHNNNSTGEITRFKKNHKMCYDVTQNYSSSLFAQITQLMFRNYLFLKRDMMILTIRLVVHLLVALIIGFLYYGIGNKATEIVNIYRFVSVTIAFLAYAGFYSHLTRYPLELPIVRVEHFNRWYSTGTYYLASVLSDIPIVVLCSTLFLVIVYTLTDQPMESYRFSNFVFFGIFTSLVAQSYGSLIGSMFRIELALVVAAFLMAAQALFSGFFIMSKDIPKSLEWCFDMTYLKDSLDGAASLVFGFNRTNLQCDEMYCHFQDPRKFMNFVGLQEDLPKSFYALFGTLIIVHILSFYAMRYRLRN